MDFADENEDLIPWVEEGLGDGERAMTAVGLLERASHTDTAVLDGGPDDRVAAHGRRLPEGT